MPGWSDIFGLQEDSPEDSEVCANVTPCFVTQFCVVWPVSTATSSQSIGFYWPPFEGVVGPTVATPAHHSSFGGPMSMSPRHFPRPCENIG